MFIFIIFLYMRGKRFNMGYIFFFTLHNTPYTQEI